MNETAQSMINEVLCIRNNGGMEDILSPLFGRVINETEYNALAEQIREELQTYDYGNGLKLSDPLCLDAMNYFMQEITSTITDKITVIERKDFDRTDIKRWEDILRDCGIM